jgi:hypothetical protein
MPLMDPFADIHAKNLRPVLKGTPKEIVARLFDIP